MKVSDGLRFSLEREFLHGKANPPKPVFSLRASAAELLVYLGYVGDDALTSVLDPASGHITGHLTFPILPNTFLSPDGSFAAAVWPTGTRTRTNAAGENRTMQWQGGIAVHNLRTGALVSEETLQNNQNIRAPWAKTTTRFCYQRRGFHLETYASSTRSARTTN